MAKDLLAEAKAFWDLLGTEEGLAAAGRLLDETPGAETIARALARAMMAAAEMRGFTTFPALAEELRKRIAAARH